MKVIKTNKTDGVQHSVLASKVDNEVEASENVEHTEVKFITLYDSNIPSAYVYLIRANIFHHHNHFM